VTTTERCVKVKILPQSIEIPKGIQNMIGSCRYVMIDELILGNKKVHDLEIGEAIDFNHKHYGRSYILKYSS